MKKLFLLWIALLLCCKSVASPYLANFDNYGKIEVAESPHGIRVDIELQVEPLQKYMIKLLSGCERASKYWIQFRHLFEVIAVSDKNGIISRSTYFPGMHNRDLQSRQLNTIAIFKLEKSYWRPIKCVPLRESHEDSRETPPRSQP